MENKGTDVKRRRLAVTPAAAKTILTQATSAVMTHSSILEELNFCKWVPVPAKMKLLFFGGSSTHPILHPTLSFDRSGENCIYLLRTLGME